MVGYDIIGSIAIMKFNGGKKKALLRKDLGEKEKKKIKEAERILKIQKNVKTVLEKAERVKGRLRTIKTRFLAGRKTLETIHKENNCRLKLNVETCYFSPRLAEERKEIAGRIKKNDKVLVLFSGVNPFGIVIAKAANPRKIVSIELSRECNKYAKENLKLNKINNAELIQGDVKKVIPRLKKLKEKFSVIVMPRPNLRGTFLKEAFSVSKKDSRIYYYCFGKEDRLGKLVEEVYRESRKAKRKIKILKIKKAGDIAPYKYRWRIDIKVLS